MRLKHVFMMFAVLTVAMTVLACSGSDDGDSGGARRISKTDIEIGFAATMSLRTM